MEGAIFQAAESKGQVSVLILLDLQQHWISLPSLKCFIPLDSGLNSSDLLHTLLATSSMPVSTSLLLLTSTCGNA